MSERACIRGCTVRDVHFAACPNYSLEESARKTQFAEMGLEYIAPCKGCAPRECRDGSLICDRCFGRMRHLLSETPDLIGRLESIADPRKATPTDVFRTGAPQILDAKSPVPDDLIDALASVRGVWFTFEGWEKDLQKMSNDVEAISWMCSLVLDRHRPVDGVREAWSVQDAIDNWGVERVDPRAVEWEDHEDGEEVVDSIREWREQLLPRDEVMRRAQISLSTLKRLERDGFVSRRATVNGERGRRTPWFYLSQVRDGMAAAEAARAADKEHLKETTP